MEYRVGDTVRIKSEWCDSPEERDYLFKVSNINEITHRMYIEQVYPIPFGYGNTILVAEGMIEKEGR